MTLRNLDIVEEVAVELVIKLGGERLAQVLCTRPQNLIRADWRSMLFLLHHCLFSLLWWCEVRMPVEGALFELDGFDRHGLNLFEIVLVV
jgi:hypothetical protein